jgi:5'-nucleotidase / UDP-sugar diphosphatase
MHFYTPTATTRRNFLRSASGTALLPFLPTSVIAEDEDAVVVSVLHTTDLHGHITPTESYADDAGNTEKDLGGLARCVTQIRAWQKENPHHVLLDIGDVYQGTHVSFANQGQLMMKLLNSMNYDAWCMGNHELDWGLDALVNAVKTSNVPVLGSNCKLGDAWLSKLPDANHPLAKVKPYVIKEVAGFRIGIIGTVTPGLPYWLAPRLLKDFSALDPVKSIDFAMKRLRAEKVDAIVLCSHMGLKGPANASRGDDFANRIRQIAQENVGIDVIIAGHTHKDLPHEDVSGVPYTQGNYYGINCGKVDLVFSKSQRKLMAVKPTTKRMDGSIALDPMILSASAKEREDSDKELTREIGELKDDLLKASPDDAPSLKLINNALLYSLKKRNVAVDGVLHGAFYEFDVKAGKKTTADAWQIVPYENYLASATFTGEQLEAVMEEIIRTPYSSHQLTGFKTEIKGSKKSKDVTSIALPDGKPLEPGKRYRIVLNSFDMQSGGQRFKLLNELAYKPEAEAQTYDIQSRDALIEFFTEKKAVGKADLI